MRRPAAPGYDSGVNGTVPRFVAALALTCGLGTADVAAQSAETVTFYVSHRGRGIGSAEVTVGQSPDGWRVTSHGRTDGPVQLSVRNFDAQYDQDWRPMSLSMEVETANEHAIVHVGMMGDVTRTDIVLPNKEALFGANDVPRDTIFLPDYVFGAWEALAARLRTASPGNEISVFAVPEREVKATLERRDPATLQTPAGFRTAMRWRITVNRETPVVWELWVDAGRLLRLDLPNERLSVVRADIAAAPEQLVP
jgi:hypothetical protein